MTGVGKSTMITDDKLPRSVHHMEAARRLVVRGVGSAMRAGQRPALVVDHASGSRIVDIDGNEYVDYVLGFGPVLLGHAPEAVVRAVAQQLDRGLIYGAQHPLELTLAELVCDLVPSAEMVAFCGSGSEAVHAALRVARAATGRDQVVKFEGHYHGWIDPVYTSTTGVEPSPDGIPPVPQHGVPGFWPPANVLICRWNQPQELEALLAQNASRIAAVIMEPVACNGGVLEPDGGYLEKVRDLCTQHGVVLIFDEVITGFRLAPGGAQQRYRVVPDLTILAKAIGSGLPISMVAGRREVLGVAHEGPVQLAGTYNSNPLSVSGAVATLREIRRDPDTLYARLEARSSALAEGLLQAGRDAGVPLAVNQVGSILHLFWDPAEVPVRSYATAASSNRDAMALMTEHLVRRGVHALPRGLWFVSAAHTDDEIEMTVEVARTAIAETAHGLRPQV